MNWREELGVEELKRERPPRGAIVIVVIGLVACLVAVLATVGKGEGEAAHLEFVKTADLPDSKPVAVPGGSQKMQLVDGLIRSTGTNVSGYDLFQVATVLEIEAGAPVGQARVLCSIAAPHGAEIGQTSGGLRALYPRSSEGGIFKQEVPETVLIDFSSHSSELAVLEVGDLPDRWTNERGVKLEWPEFEAGTEHLKYFIAGGKPKKDMRLPFNSIWRSTTVPKATIACTLTTSAGKATVQTQGELRQLPPPIDEEAEEEEQERRAEEETAQEEETDEAGGEGE
jgi:hypothetical protein